MRRAHADERCSDPSLGGSSAVVSPPITASIARAAD
jgi:hypothetical protein